MKKIRIDQLLVDLEYYQTADEAKRAIMAGLIFDDNIRIDTAGEKVDPLKVKLRIKDKRKKYVSRGGYKLEKAINYFGIQLNDKILLDIGSSTGGFTDCALKYGAQKSYALDVGTNQLAYQLRVDPRVTVMEQTNFRFVEKSQFNPLPNFVSIDVSFISLKLIFNQLVNIIQSGCEVVALIKPQFEVEKSIELEKGIVTQPEDHIYVIDHLLEYVRNKDFVINDLTHSPIKGGKGNIEYLLYLTYNKNKNDHKNNTTFSAENIVKIAFQELNHC
ncbi:TlyA family RNA methyltransferase [Macrococcus sp. DPC7161]|uniref:TlyA family RNA methyltransferase n=1 Tax=Macrococcus sp. DPC7161 TaxID=2507060 RepID=UPI00100A3397|nr:TlyA family RNA methyltransferase [Macrococcus sp. DPC7161]RXK19332.1 TlyA family RNA methyltransferase [Macrococcus sp. DPC7161]